MPCYFPETAAFTPKFKIKEREVYQLKTLRFLQIQTNMPKFAPQFMRNMAP